MRTRYFKILVILCVLLFPVLFENSLAQNSAVKVPPPIKGLSPQESPAPQKLNEADISILTARGENHELSVELAITGAQHAKGLMHRDKIEAGTGMLFLYHDERERNFWMKNTLIPLDIIFIRHDGAIHHIHSEAQPGSLDLISSNGAVKAVLEIAGGEAEDRNINIGDRVIYDAFLSTTAGTPNSPTE